MLNIFSLEKLICAYLQCPQDWKAGEILDLSHDVVADVNGIQFFQLIKVFDNIDSILLKIPKQT